MVIGAFPLVEHVSSGAYYGVIGRKSNSPMQGKQKTRHTVRAALVGVRAY
ncbi:hypothetical protein ARMA_2718 [Ardenticatena maritima]|uniref:Uncharacterized protein n=1 Tax=Ardenticatena maritima TaxID=872965 RepID=A0A0M9UDR3_9CHLR|nr:hypothetical protein ARMA_2718 [Ardenticatena maritima]